MCCPLLELGDRPPTAVLCCLRALAACRQTTNWRIVVFRQKMTRAFPKCGSFKSDGTNKTTENLPAWRHEHPLLHLLLVASSSQQDEVFVRQQLYSFICRSSWSVGKLSRFSAQVRIFVVPVEHRSLWISMLHFTSHSDEQDEGWI